MSAVSASATTSGRGRPARIRARTRRAAWIAFAWVALATLAWPAASHAAAELNGYLQESIAVRTGEGDVIFHRQTLNTKFEATLSRLVLMRLEADVWRDDPEFLEARVRSRLREGYLRLRFEDFDLRLGRVQIAWGEAEGVIVSDQVSPFDIENFITPGFDEIRMGVDGAFLDYYFDADVQLQLFWITHFEAPDFPNPRSPWYPIDLGRLDVPGLSVELEPFRYPDDDFSDNSEWGVRLSGRPTVADWAVGYLRSYDRRPTLHVRPGDTPGVFSLTPEFSRFDLFTANVAYPTHGVLLKGDLAFEHDRSLQLAPEGADLGDPELIDAFSDEFVSRHDVLRTLVGLDAKPDVGWWHNADASFQWVHEEVFDAPALLATAERTDLFSVLLRAAYRNETIKPWLFAIANVRGDDLWVQAKVDYEGWDDWRISLEADWFEGHEFDGKDGGIYGLFDENDMVKTSVRYSF